MPEFKRSDVPALCFCLAPFVGVIFDAPWLWYLTFLPVWAILVVVLGEYSVIGRRE